MKMFLMLAISIFRLTLSAQEVTLEVQNLSGVAKGWGTGLVFPAGRSSYSISLNGTPTRLVDLWNGSSWAQNYGPMNPSEQMVLTFGADDKAGLVIKASKLAARNNAAYRFGLLASSTLGGVLAMAGALVWKRL